ncbi:C-type lectin domain family 2 member B-like [Colius striatus]|uniref:C-type lectin domain family 2 member B-like n=1 Tax=Colius striatus TaxID=57412 RepID=UPI002B1DE5F3|nr:C-type lectin domain family 2 member B-like [Colius striatus]
MDSPALQHNDSSCGEKPESERVFLNNSQDKSMPSCTSSRQEACEHLGKLNKHHSVCALVLAVLLALILALSVALAVQSAGSRAAGAALPAAPGLGCAYDWVGYRNMCYYVSAEEGSWSWSQAQCSRHGASLAMLQEEWEMEFLQRLKGDLDCWVGVRRQGEHLEQVDGSNFTFSSLVHGKAACVYLIETLVGSSDCSLHRPYICSKPQAVTAVVEK